jgi:O-antigen/teichoic acid export membrane protein
MTVNNCFLKDQRLIKQDSIKGLSLRSNFIWAFVGNAINAFSMWLLLVVLVKFSTVETVGVFALGQAICAPISLFLSCKLQLVQVTDANNDYDFGHYLGLKLIASLLAIVASIIVGFSFYSNEVALVISVLSFSYAIVSIREVFLGVMQKSERMDKISISNILFGFISLVFFGAVYLACKNLLLSIAALIFSRVLIVIANDFNIAKLLLSQGIDSKNYLKLAPLFDKKILHLAWLVAPLGVVALFTSLLTSIPRIVLDGYCGQKGVGYFGAISSLLAIGTMFAAALGQATSPRLARYFVEDRRSYVKLLIKLLMAGLLIGTFSVLLSVVFGKFILTFLFAKDYADFTGIFIKIMIAGAVLILFSFVNIGLTATRSFRVQILIYFIAVSSCLLSSLLLIPSYGISGAAWSILISYLIGFVLCTIFLIMAVKKLPCHL